MPEVVIPKEKMLALAEALRAFTDEELEVLSRRAEILADMAATNADFKRRSELQEKNSSLVRGYHSIHPYWVLRVLSRFQGRSDLGDTVQMAEIPERRERILVRPYNPPHHLDPFPQYPGQPGQ